MIFVETVGNFYNHYSLKFLPRGSGVLNLYAGIKGKSGNYKLLYAKNDGERTPWENQGTKLLLQIVKKKIEFEWGRNFDLT